MNITASSAVSDRVMPLLLILIIGSGCSALVDEIVWFEPLCQVVGASPISLAIVLISFMGGLLMACWRPVSAYVRLRCHR